MAESQNPDQSRQQYDELWTHLWAHLHAGGPMARSRYRFALKWLGLEAGSRQRLLDVGAGNGAFMAAAIHRSPSLDIYGAEFSSVAITSAPAPIASRLALCDLQGGEPLPWGGDFELMSCMEVLEHLPDDLLALRHITGALAPGGRLFVSVPAWQSQWGVQDVAAGHVRRYDPQVLSERLESSGLTVRRLLCWGGPFSWIYMSMADLIGPKRVMSVQPTGAAGAAASLIYHVLKADDLLSFGGGGQLFALADKPVAA